MPVTTTSCSGSVAASFDAGASAAVSASDAWLITHTAVPQSAAPKTDLIGQRFMLYPALI